MRKDVHGMSSFLDVTAGDLARLGPEEAVRLFRGLLWADAHIYRTRIDVPSKIDAPDGGVDATVIVPDGAHLPAGPSVIQSGLTYYQIKTEKSTSIADKAFRRRLLYGSAKSSKLSPRIKECFDAGGTMVFVLFGSDTPSRSDAEALLRQELPVGPHYADAKIEVWRQNELIWHLGRHPALRRMAKGSGHAEYLDHDGWGKNKDMGGRFVRGGQHDAFIGDIRRELCSAAATGDKHVDVRLAGPPGSGKTRLAHEITRARDLAPFVLYFENPAPLEDNRILNALVEGEHEYAILVVDECDASERERIGNRIYGAGGRIRLVTIYNKKDDGNAHDIPPLGDAEIKKIIQGYDAPVGAAAVDMLASLCTPSPRYAHRLAERMRSDPDGFFRRPLDPEWLHKNYIAGSLDIEGKEYKDREAVLSWFGLFEMVGHDPPYAAESGFLAQNVERHMGIAPGMFDRIIDDLRGLKILQGYRTLYVAPEMLHLWLWNEWWKVYGARFDLATFLYGDETSSGNPMPPRLLDWFAQMLASASALPEAKRIAGKMLSADGPLGGDGGMLENLYGAKIFHSSAMADPEAALALLSATVGAWDDARLAAFREGRREVVWALEAIALRSMDIDAVARVLLRLATNENENVSNNATGVLVRLFSPAPGELAATSASPDDLYRILAKMLADAGKPIRLLGLRACDEALESVHFTRMDYERSQILTAEVKAPDDDRIRGYKRVLKMLTSGIGTMPRDEAREAARILLKRAAELSWVAGLSADAAGALRCLHAQKIIGDEDLLRTALLVVRAHGGGVDERAAAAWKGLAERAYDKGDYGSRMSRFVKMSIAADIAPGRGGAGGPSERDEQIRDLAAETLLDGGLLEGVSGWIFGPAVNGAVQFGDELGRQDGGFSMLKPLIKAASGAVGPAPGAGEAAPGGPSHVVQPDILLGAYLAHAFERDPGLWEATMDSMVGDPRLAPLVPQVTWRSGISDRAWDRIAGLYRRGVVTKSEIAIFAHAGRPCRMSDRAFAEAVAIMREPPASAPDMRGALALLAGRCGCSGRRLGVPLDALHAVVADDLFLSGADEEMPDMLTDSMWEAASRRLVEDDPDRIPALAGAAFDAMGSGGGVFGPNGGAGAWSVLDMMVAAAPGPVWESASGRITIPPDARSRSILSWLGGSVMRPGSAQHPAPPPLDAVPLGAVWKWVDEDPGARAACLAERVPRVIRRAERCIARDILVRYGADRGVRIALRRRFLPGAWIGPEAIRLEEEMAVHERSLRGEDDPNVRLWLEEMIKYLRGRLEAARAADERMP